MPRTSPTLCGDFAEISHKIFFYEKCLILEGLHLDAVDGVADLVLLWVHDVRVPDYHPHALLVGSLLQKQPVELK